MEGTNGERMPGTQPAWWLAVKPRLLTTIGRVLTSGRSTTWSVTGLRLQRLESLKDIGHERFE
jgi:hypothetical protein